MGLDVRLTTVRYPLDDMCRVAVRMLVERLQQERTEPRSELLMTRLVVRESSVRS